LDREIASGEPTFEAAAPQVSFNAELRRRLAASWNAGIGSIHSNLLSAFGKKPSQ
jgi:hypothetical protein